MLGCVMIDMMLKRWVCGVALAAGGVLLVPGCVQMMSQQESVAGVVGEGSATTATGLYCGSTARDHYFCFRYATGLPGFFVRVPLGEVTVKGPWPRKFTRRRSHWVVLSDQALARLIREAAQEPVTFPTVY